MTSYWQHKLSTFSQEHNRHAARTEKQKRVSRIESVEDVDVLLQDAPAFQTHCMEV